MRRVLRWIWAPMILAVALACIPTKQAAAQTSVYFGGPRGSFGFSSGGYYGAPYAVPYAVPYGAYYGPRPYYPRPYPAFYGGYGHHHGRRHCRW